MNENPMNQYDDRQRLVSHDIASQTRQRNPYVGPRTFDFADPDCATRPNI